VSVTVSGRAARPHPPERAWKERGPRILVVDDEPGRRLLRAPLASEGYRVFEASTGQAALADVGAVHPDLVILDLALPDVGGLEVIRRLREWSRTPIVVVSASDAAEQKVAALDAGADDYLTEPFSVGELLARMRAALRHAARGGTEPVVTSGALTVDLLHRRVTVAGRDVALTPVEYSLLKTLALSAGAVLAHRHLLREV
jgi:two-component system KDP operon response regulator KdpE